MNAVIFDLDGLLIDSEKISYEIILKLLEPFGIDFSLKEYAQQYSGKTEVTNIRHLIEEYQLPLKLEEGLEKTFALEREMLFKHVDLKPGARELLDYLKKGCFKIALASSSTEERALKIREDHGIRDYFDAFSFGHEVENGKPAPDIFLKACEKIGEDPENCLVLEDREAGIQAAYSAGIPVICIPDMKRPGQEFIEKTECLLDSLVDVITWMESAE